MRILIVTDAWAPQINGVVRTLLRTRQELEGLGHELRVISPDLFANLPCPTYPEIRLAVLPGRRLPKLIDAFQPCAIHIATEGPLGQAARRYCLLGRPEDCLEQLRGFARAGARHFIFVPLSDPAAFVERAAKEILPSLRSIAQ